MDLTRKSAIWIRMKPGMTRELEAERKRREFVLRMRVQRTEKFQNTWNSLVTNQIKLRKLFRKTCCYIPVTTASTPPLSENWRAAQNRLFLMQRKEKKLR